MFYRSFYEAVKELPPEEFKKSVCAIMNYGLDEIEPGTSGIEKTIYLLTKPQIDANNKRYVNGKKGGRKPNQEETEAEPNRNQEGTKEEPKLNQEGTEAEPNVNVNVNDNVNDNVNVNDKESIRRTKFVPPTPKEVSGYCADKGYTIDAERFIDFYESKGWFVGKNKMKDWRAAVRNWGRSEKTANPEAGRKELTAKPKKNSFNNFQQREYDYDELERQLLNSKPASG